MVRLLPFALLLSCGARTELREEPCAPPIATPIVRSPECDEACSPPCVPFRAVEIGCNGTCRRPPRMIACWKRVVTYGEVGCLEHGPTGARFRTSAAENLDDRGDLRRAGYVFGSCATPDLAMCAEP